VEQKDYLLREIEKIGQMLRMILERIGRRKEKETTTFADHEQEVNGWLKEETGFELEEFMNLQGEQEAQYLKGLKGFNSPNLELLADVLMALGTDDRGSAGPDYLYGAKKLYAACEKLERSYSMERQEKMNQLDNLLENNKPSRQ
jgi:hypothetical protein